jgi:hypothetical protein
MSSEEMTNLRNAYLPAYLPYNTWQSIGLSAFVLTFRASRVAMLGSVNRFVRAA